MGEPVKIIELARDLIELSGLRVEQDINIEISGLRPGEKLFEELLNDNENNFATEHERIFISQLEEVDESNLFKTLNKFNSLFKSEKKMEYINTLVNIVDTYMPKRDNIREVDFTKKSRDEVASESEQ